MSIFHGTTYITTEFYEVTLTSINGCDSIAYLDLSFTNPCALGFKYSIDMQNPDCEEAENGWIEIYPTGDPPKWNGTFRGKDAPLGVYIYTLTWTTSQGSKEVLSRDVTLVR